MIQKIGEEWAGVEESLRRLPPESQRGELRQVLRAVQGVQDALRRLGEVSVTRVNFREAVRDAVRPILREAQVTSKTHPAGSDTSDAVSTLRQEVVDLRQRLNGLGEAFESLSSSDLDDGVLEADSAEAGEAVPAAEVLSRLAEFEERLRKLDDLEDQIESSVAGLDARLGALATRVDESSGALTSAEGKVHGLASGVEDLKDGLTQLQEFAGEINFRISEVEDRHGQSEGLAEEAHRALTESIARLEDAVTESLARAEARETEAQGHFDQRIVELAAAFRAELQKGMETTRSGILGTMSAADASLAASIRSELLDEIARRHSQLESKFVPVAESSRSLLARFVDLESAMPAAIDRRAATSESTLRSELSDVSEKLGAALAQLRSALPDAIEKRAAATEERFRTDLGSLEGRVKKDVTSREASLRGEFKSGVETARQGLDVRLAQLRQSLTEAVLDLEKKHASAIASLKDGMERRVKEGLETLEGALSRSRDELSGMLQRLEASVPVTAEGKTRELEEKLQGEIDAMVDTLTGRVAELRDMLARVEGLIPRRESVDALDGRLARLEDRISKVATQVESIDSLTPEMRTIADRFASLRQQVSEVSHDVATAGRGVTSMNDVVAKGLTDLEGVINAGISRWETDQSHMLERLSAIRDTLRDQLRSVGEHVGTSRSGLLGRLTGKKDGDVHVPKDEWDHVSTKLEGILSGLESILSKKPKR